MTFKILMYFYQHCRNFGMKFMSETPYLERKMFLFLTDVQPEWLLLWILPLTKRLSVLDISIINIP